MDLLRFWPAAEYLVYPDKIDLRELGRKSRRDLRIRRPIKIAPGDFLPLLAVKILEVGLRHLAGAMLVGDLVDNSHRRFGPYADGRHHEVGLFRAHLLHRHASLDFSNQQDV